MTDLTEHSEEYVDDGWWVPRWAVFASVAITLLGLADSVYLTIAHYSTAAILACSDTGTINCAKVTTSPQSVIFGVPVAVLGLAFFTAMFVASLPRVWQSGVPRFGQTRLMATVVGMGMVVYLIYAELYEIHAICLFCTAVHVLTFLLFVVTLAAYYSDPEPYDSTAFAERGGTTGAALARLGSARSVGRMVSRAARTGGGRAYSRRNTPWSWWTTIGTIVILGIALVTYSRYERLHPAAATPSKQSTTPPTLQDHWFEAYAVDLCGTIEPALPTPAKLTGITTKGDGLIHVAPLSSADTGANATLGRFVGDVPGFQLSSTTLQYPGHSAYHNGQSCGGKPGQVQVMVWNSPQASKGTLVSGDPAKLRLKNDQLITMSFLPTGSKIPKPSARDVSGLLSAVTSASGSATTTTAQAPTTTTTKP